MSTKRKPTIWIPIDQSFNLPPDTYVVSNYGECKTIKTGYIKNVKPDRNKYIDWKFYSNGKFFTFKAHIIIATSFKLPKLEGQTTVDHIDRNRSNNCLDNLRWASPKEQNKNRIIPSTTYSKSKGKIEQYDLNGKYIKTWNSNKEASDILNLDSRRISDVCSGKRNSIGGFIWKYAETLDLLDEIWKVYQKYFVSGHGRVKTPRGIIMKPHLSSGYWRLNINKIKIFVHQLVCMVFHGPKPSDKHTVDHIDRNPLNNHKDNLRWATKEEQSINRKSVRKINQICPTTNKVLGIFNNAVEAARKLGIKQPANILQVCKGIRYKTCGGFKFKFAE